MADLLVRDVPPKILEALKNRAEKNRRSVQQELLLILEDATGKEYTKATEAAGLIRERLAAYDRNFTDSTDSIREDRER